MSTALTMRSPVVIAGERERQILVRIDRAVRVSEDELRYQLRRKDSHPLAELEDRRGWSRRSCAFAWRSPVVRRWPRWSMTTGRGER
jgi:hypothetical protein